MIKKKLNILFFILLLVLFLGSFSTSYAMSKSEAFEYCRDNCGFASLFSTSGTPSNSGWYSYDGYKSYLDSKTQDIFYVYKVNDAEITSSSANFEINFYDNISINGNTFTVTNNSYYNADRKTVNQAAYLNYYRVGNGGAVNAGTYNLTFPTYNNSFYMLYANGFIVAASFDLPLTSHFDPNHDYIVSVNNINNVNCLLRNWSIYQWEIGQTTDFIDLDSYSMYFYDEINDVEIGTIFANNNQNTLVNNGALYYSNGNLYVNSRLISHNVLYRLYIEKWLDGVQTSEEYYFIFLPRNAVVSNGQIINIGSGDFNVQDSTNNIIDNVNDIEAFENVMNELSQSGELIKRLDYKVYPNHSYDILFALTQNICDTLYASGDTYIDINIHNYSHRFYSSDFTIPTNQLTIWIQMALVFGYCYLLYKQASELIHAIQEGDLYVLELEDADEYFYM